MHKIIYILFLLMICFMGSPAQKKIIYEDSSLLQQEVPAAPAEDFSTDESITADEINTEPEKEEPIDTTLYPNNLQLPYDSVKKWRNLKAYAYTNYLDSLLKEQNEAEVKPVTRSYGTGILNNILGSGLVGFLLWTSAICFILFIMYRLFLADGAFIRKPKTENQDAAPTAEIISSESDFDGHIQTALQQGNFRQAVRYQYLRTLHSLAKKELIELAPDKTNYHYVHEIANSHHQKQFASLTLNYEYVWYGEFVIDQQIYLKIENDFISLNQKL